MKGLDENRYAFNLVIVFCYLLRDSDILLIRRRKEPYRGHLTVPGGKKERGESLFDTCRREVFEETGLIVDDISLSGIVSNYGNSMNAEVMSFYFLSRSFHGVPCSGPEGDVDWYNIDQSFFNEGISPFYKLISPLVLEERNRLFNGRINIDDYGNILSSDLLFL